MILLYCIERPNHRICLPVTQWPAGPAPELGAIEPAAWRAIAMLADFVEVANQLQGPSRQRVIDAVRRHIVAAPLPDGVELRLI